MPSLALDRKTFTTRATGFGIGIGKFKSARHQSIRKIQVHAAQVERTLGIDQHRNPLRPNQDISPLGRIDKRHLVGEAVAPAASDLDAQPGFTAFPRTQLRGLTPGGGSEKDQTFVAFAHPLGKLRCVRICHPANGSAPAAQFKREGIIVCRVSVAQRPGMNQYWPLPLPNRRTG